MCHAHPQTRMPIQTPTAPSTSVCGPSHSFIREMTVTTDNASESRPREIAGVTKGWAVGLLRLEGSRCRRDDTRFDSLMRQRYIADQDQRPAREAMPHGFVTC